MTTEQRPRIFELHVKPTYTVCIPQRDYTKGMQSERRKANEVNLRSNTPREKMSYKATRRLTNSVNWLVASAKKQWIYDKKTNKRYSFQVNFVTLTLPTTEHNISDHFFKKVLLHNFINTCRYRFGLKNYIWKVEAQENGNIHAHFTTDTFIHWRELRTVWNRILSKHGLIEPYMKKHSSLSFSDYCKTYNPDNKRTYSSMLSSFKYGCSTNWQDPNTTDVHAVWKVNDIAAYLAKYMSKKEDGRRSIKGRLWGCSSLLSENNKLVIEMVGNEDKDLLDSLFNPAIAWKPIQIASAVGNSLTTVGEMFFYKISDWGKILTGRLLAMFNEHRFNIRHNLDFPKVQPSKVISLLPPPVIEIITNNFGPVQSFTPKLFS